MNNKGFAFSTMLYGFMIIGCLIFLIILGLMSTNRTNTREMVNKIEDDSARLSLASKTITKNENGKNYRDYDVPLGFTGWYKIELWGNGYYSSRTVYLKELAIIRFFIGSDSSDTYACSSNVYGPKAGESFNPEQIYTSQSDAEIAYEKLIIHDILTTSDCTSNNALILSSTTSGNNDAIKQLGDGVAKISDTEFKIINFSINAKQGNGSGRPVNNSIKQIEASGGKARITYVSNKSSLSNGGTDSSTICTAQSGHSGIYYIKSSSGFWENTDKSQAISTNKPFTGNKEQKWLVQCKPSPSSSNCIAINIYSLKEKSMTSCSSLTFYNAGY